MLRHVDLNEISDGKLYTANDMVRAGCGDCEGCSECCENMADTIVLDPLDVFRLCFWLGCDFRDLLAERIELGVVDGVSLPHMKISGQPARCSFLSGEGRCEIHEFRPGFCRLFPLGRYYMDGGFRYFLQTKECRRSNRTKVKVRKWIDTPDFERYEKFVCDWHYYLKGFQDKIAGGKQEPDFAKKISLMILENFYQAPFNRDEDFYIQFYSRMKQLQQTEPLCQR